MSVVGTLAWASETGGRLNFQDRVALARLAGVTLISALPDLVKYRLGLKRRFPAAVDLEGLSVPDTVAAREAEAILTELTPPFMVNHSLRTYWFSRLIGLGAGLPFDDEVLYVASLTHDLGFYGAYSEPAPASECFTIRSARAATDVVDRAGWDASRRARVAEAVVLNANGEVPIALGAEAHLMMRGVLVDATGVHAWRIHPENVSAVFERLPLLDQKDHLFPTFSSEADRHPQCRGYFAKNVLQFGLMVKLAPWNAP